ncbi:GDP-L-fucose synthase [Candidatus Planktophila vernalis]|uniref:GDP-L-fucose synthase n=1 Tax=Candidatus Planktophila vernalis TaxID=1884907 RepID=A0A249KUM3_9ACTN|nr:GDP-L-fucose synthase [Candidatus Planktophila vernalis]ASY20502.1 GDP-L-fucose synthase [Candidatus Planktophila vernalis]
MRVYVAGSSGLVGSAISRAVVNKGYELIASKRSEVDLFDFSQTLTFISDTKPDLVIDAAARVGGILANREHPVDFLLENLRIQENLMRASNLANISRFVFLGSSCIYPRNALQPIKEEYLMTGPLEETNSAYSIAKIAGVELIKSYRRQFGRKWISLMPTNIYGPNDNFNLETSHVLAALIHKFLSAANSGQASVTLWGTGSARREFLHADDLARAVLVAVDKYDSESHLNVGTGEDISIKEVAQLIAKISGYYGAIKWDPTKPDGTPQKLLEVTKIKKLGWNPEISLEDGISSTMTWFKSAIERGEVKK